MTLDLQATPEEVMRAVETLQEFAQAHGVPEKSIFGLALALEECGSNVVNHALEGNAEKQFQVAFEYAGGIFSIELQDAGPAFDPTAAPEGKSQAEEGDPLGGWGIQLVRNYMDKIQYQREQERNVLRLSKRIDPAQA